VRQNFGRFRSCYERALATKPALRGRVAVHFVIDATGRVASVRGESDLGNPVLVGCVTNAFRTIEFPSPERGDVRVTFPMDFAPPGD
jgi:Ca-activated chloride channel family protein